MTRSTLGSELRKGGKEGGLGLRGFQEEITAHHWGEDGNISCSSTPLYYISPILCTNDPLYFPCFFFFFLIRVQWQERKRAQCSQKKWVSANNTQVAKWQNNTVILAHVNIIYLFIDINSKALWFISKWAWNVTHVPVLQCIWNYDSVLSPSPL